MITILFLLPDNPYYYSAAVSNRWLTYIKSFLTLGVSVKLVILDGFLSIEEKNDFRNNKDKNPNIIYISTCRQYNGCLRKLFHIAKYLYLFDVMRTIKIKRLLKKEKPDFVFFGCFITRELNISAIAKKTNCKLILEASEFEDISRPNALFRKIEYIIHLKRFYSLLPHITLFTIMTKTLCQHYEELTGQKGNIIHIPMTVDLSRFDKTSIKTAELKEMPKPYIAYCGSLSNKKDGLSILIKSFAAFHKHYPQYHLCLAGRDHPDVNGQKELIKSLNVHDNIHYIGMLDQSVIPEFLCNATICVLARPRSHQAEGGFPTKLGEYLASGNPVCVTKTGEIADYLQDGVSAFLAEPDSVDSFTNALCRAASDLNHAEIVGKIGRNVAENNFNMNIHVNRLLNRLETILTTEEHNS